METISNAHTLTKKVVNIVSKIVLLDDLGKFLLYIIIV